MLQNLSLWQKISILIVVGITGIGVVIHYAYLNGQKPSSVPGFDIETFVRRHGHHDQPLVKRIEVDSETFARQPLKVDSELLPYINQLQLTSQGSAVLSKARNVRMVAKTQCGGGAIGCAVRWIATDPAKDPSSIVDIEVFYDIEVKRGSEHILDILAHEFLHIVYWELSADQKARITPGLETTYSRHKSNLDIALSGYDFRDNDHRLNELHSFIATYVQSPPAGLEAHYGQYFKRSVLSKYFWIKGSTNSPDTSQPGSTTKPATTNYPQQTLCPDGSWHPTHIGCPDVRCPDGSLAVVEAQCARHQCLDGSWEKYEHWCNDHQCVNGEWVAARSECKDVQCHDGSWVRQKTLCKTYQCPDGSWVHYRSMCQVQCPDGSVKRGSSKDVCKTYQCPDLSWVDDKAKCKTTQCSNGSWVNDRSECKDYLCPGSVWAFSESECEFKRCSDGILVPRLSQCGS